MDEGIEEASGTFDRFVWTNDDGSWVIGKLSDGTSFVGPGPADLFVRGVDYVFSGKWEKHEKFGHQFRYRSVVAQKPVTDSAITNYLKKVLFGKGLRFGNAAVRKMLAEVGAEKCLAVMKTDPDLVSKVTGISRQKCVEISEILIGNEKNESARIDLVHLLDGYGFTQDVIDRAIREFGVCAAERIRRDPFTMLVRGYRSAGFLRCDRLYCDLGLPRNRMKRQVICIWHILQSSGGSVWMKASDLATDLSRLVSSDANPERAIRLGLRAKWLCGRRDSDGVFWVACYEDAMNEIQIARRCFEMIHQRATVEVA